MILYNKDKWLDIVNDEKYEKIREKILTSFNDLVFVDEGHRYFVGDRELQSVSVVTHLYKKHFDSVLESKKTSERNWDNPKSKYYRMTPEEILAQWQKKSADACSRGTSIHLFGEMSFYYMIGQYEQILPEFRDRFTPDGGFESRCKEEDAVVKFYQDIPKCVVPILAETRVYDKDLGYAGTFDILFYYDAELDNKTVSESGLMVMDYKGLDVNTPIFTQNKGWITMGTIEEGDVVFDKNGDPSKVLHTSSIHNKKCYKIKLDNNVETIADFDHRWEITYGGYNKNRVDVLTTEELYEHCKNIEKKRITGNIPRIKQANALFSDKDMCNIDPYVLGVWLGDGHSACGMITNMYDEIFSEIEKRGFSIDEDVSKGGSGKAKSRTIYGLSTLLRKYNLLNNKHMPSEVLLSTFEYKKMVLAGIMDTDGYYHSKRKRFILSTSRIKQSEFITQLLNSMGIKSTLLKMYKICNGKKIQCYDVTFTCNFNPFYMRNINVDVPKTNKHGFANIVSIERCESVPTRCIEVDSPTHTFLYGNNFTITHNTNEDLYKNFKEEKLLKPFDGLLDMPLSVYKLQLSLYQICLENIGFKTVARRILWLKPDGIYDKIGLEEFTDTLRKDLIGKIK